MIFILFAFRYHVHGAPSLLPVAESNFRWNVHFFHPPLMCLCARSSSFPSFLVPLSLAPLMLLSAQLHSVCAPTCHHVPAGALPLRSCTRENCTRTRTMTNWWWRAGGHEPKTAHCILTEWGIKSSLSFSISSAEMQSLDSSVTVLQGFENITRA